MELPIRYLNEKGQLDDGETSQMRYVYDIMYGEGEPYHNADWSVVIYPSEVKLVDIPSAAEIFAERYNTGQIICPYKYESYISNDGDLMQTHFGCLSCSVLTMLAACALTVSSDDPHVEKTLKT